MGVMTSPLIAIDGKPVLLGSTNDINRIKELLTVKNAASETNKCCEECGDDCNCQDECCETPEPASTCSCGGNC